MNFDTAFDRIIKVEGNYADVTGDPGGETMYGITVALARQYGYTGDMNVLPLDTAKQIYYKEFWLYVGADLYDGALGYQVFDCAVNVGKREAAILLQHAVGATPDGDIGPQTQAAITALGATATVFKFIAERLRYYGGLIGEWNKFGRGWTTNRIPQVLDYAAQDLTPTT